MLRILKCVAIAIVVLSVGIFGFVSLRSYKDAQVDYEVDLAGTEIPTYIEFELPHEHAHSDATSLPFTASAVIDINGDGTEELFIGGTHQQADVLYRFNGAGFEEIQNIAGIDKPEGGSSLGAIVLDTDRDGDQDLIVTRPTGIWLYTNEGGTFRGQKLDTPLRDDTTTMSIAVADINGDGHFDMYAAGYVRNDLVEGLNIFNKEGYGGTSALLINRGDNTFENQTHARGLLYTHNTFQAAFSDVDLDGDLDLIVAHDTGQVRTWENDGTGTFSNVTNPNSAFYSYPMGIGIADYDNDGLTDFFFSNVGSTPPHFMVKGDLRDDQQHDWKWLLFRNKGDMQFENTASKAKIADYEFAWGGSFEDLNLDGREDLLVSQNYVTAPFHKIPFMRLPGRLFVQNAQGEFAEVGKEAGVVNKRYSIAPLTADFNGDGRPDIVHVNVGGRSKAFLSRGGSGNGYLKIRLPDDVSSIGAMVTVTLENGDTISKPYVSGEGLASDSSRVIIAGLGDQKATSIAVRFIGGKTARRSGSFRNETLSIGQ